MNPTAVIKVGGSLLDWPELPSRLTAYLRARARDRLLVIVGGGSTADVIRSLDHVHQLGEERAHALALRALDLTAHLLNVLIPGLCVIDDSRQCAPVWESGRVPILAPRRFLDEDDRLSSDPLPHSWNVTTDSIAARVAERLGAVELVLLKSAPLPRGDAARSGVVDATFFQAAGRLDRVLYLNLRDPLATPSRLRRSLDGYAATGPE